MRRQLTEALSYPALMVRQLVDAGNYPHQSLYEATGQRCHKCDGDDSCGWDACLQDFRKLDDRSIEFLAETLREGIKLVEALNSELMHDETTCNCVTCRWIREAEHLVEESEHHLPHVEPAVVARAHEEAAAE